MNFKKMKELKVNVAPTSEEGHFIHNAKVVNLDEVTETFEVIGKSELRTKNHTTLIRDEDCIVTCQVVFNSKLNRLERAKD